MTAFRLQFHHRDARIAGVLFLTAFFTFVFFKVDLFNANSVTRLAFCLAVVEDGSFVIDKYARFTMDKSFVDGHYYCDKAPGAGLLALPFVAGAHAVLRSVGIDDYATPRGSGLEECVPNRNFEFMLLVASLPVSILCAGAVAVMFLVGRQYGASQSVSVVAALLLGVGTPFWAWSTILFGHSLAGAFLLFGTFSGIKFLSVSRLKRKWMCLAGFLLAYAVLVEYPTAVAACMVGLMFLGMEFRRSRTIAGSVRIALFLFAGALPVALVFFGYNTLCFGGPLTLGYESVDLQAFPEMSEGFCGLRRPDFSVLYKTIFTPEWGILWYSPFLVLSPILAVRNIWQRRAVELNLLALAVPAYFFLLNASYAYWDHSVFPCRHVTASLPFAVLPFLFRDYSRDRTETLAFRRLIGTLVAVSLSIRLLAFLLPETFRNGPDLRYLLKAADANVLGMPNVTIALVWIAAAIWFWKTGEKQTMPVVSRFYGIIVKMYFIQREHQPPHFHAIYGEFNGVFEISSLEMIEGDLPGRAEKLVKEWAGKYQIELQNMWDTQEFFQLPGLE